MKKVLLIVVDALASRVVRPALEEGRLPNLARLIDGGHVDWDSTAIFPSITPAATAALVTGCYPTDTGVTGAYFYDPDEDHVHYYGDDFWAILRHGIGEFFDDFLVRLNQEQLRSPTAFEIVERAGLQAACLNYLWFRGQVEHQVHVPWLLRIWPGMPKSRTIQGPEWLSLGDFVTGGKARGRLPSPGGLFRRFGFSDVTTGKQLLKLAARGDWPDFTLAYFPDNDFDSHASGPAKALRTVARFDRTLGKLAAARGGWNALLEELAIVITGDHSQSDLPLDQSSTGIRLDDLLDDYNVVPAGQDWRNDEELMICPNMRAAQIYLRPDYWTRRQTIIDRLLTDERIDQVMWRETVDSREEFHVAKREHGVLKFGPSGTGEISASDSYGNDWSLKGDLAVVDARLGDDGLLEYEDYPNALERIATSFDQRASGDIWVTSRLGYEFRLDDTSVHRGGSHGSLHKGDSLSPLVLAGVPDDLFPRKTPRSVDVAPLCLAVLGLEHPHEVGQGRYRETTASRP